MQYKNIICVADDSKKAQEAYKLLRKRYSFIKDKKKADVIIALGGDGFMLHTLHEHMDGDIPIYGMNRGSIGFLMNEYREGDLLECLARAKQVILHPLQMTAKTVDGKIHTALAINEVSMLRESRQAATLKIKVDGKVRVKELVSDGVLVATPAGSTAYNLSVHGPILPLGCGILALTPISPFRPRRWRGALLNQKAVIDVEVLNYQKRPVSAVADFTEIRDVVSVAVKEIKNKKVKILFDPKHSLEERIISEQFMG